MSKSTLGSPVFDPPDVVPPNTLLAGSAEAVPLYKGPCHLTLGATSLVGFLEVVADWDGQARATCFADMPQSMKPVDPAEATLRIDRSWPVLELAAQPVDTYQEDLFGETILQLDLRLAPQYVKVLSDRTARVSFTLANFPMSSGAPISATVGRATSTGKRIRFDDGRWQVTLDSVFPWLAAHWQLETEPRESVPLDLCGEVLRGQRSVAARDLLQELLNAPEGPPSLPRGVDLSVTGAAIKALHSQDHGGTAITHAGELRRVDNSLFSQKDAARVLEPLRVFVRLLAGADSALLTERGHRRDGAVLWQRWAGPTAGRSRLGTWLPSAADPSSDVSLAWAGFRRLWEDEVTRPLLVSAVDAFVLSSAIESAAAGLVQAQAGLETLAYRELHLGRRVTARVVGGGGAQALPAADKIRLLLALTGVGADIPSTLSDLQAWCAQSPTVFDGPHAIAELRNDAVHAISRSGAGAGVTEQARRLAVHYLLRCLLAWIGYEGEVSGPALV
jgi:hypothetical protein